MVPKIEDGELRLEPTRALKPEELETLKALYNGPHWAFYKRILLKSKDAYFNSILPMNNPNEVLKQVGIVAGINFAINLLQVLCLDYERRVQKELEKDTKESKPFKRG